MKLKIVSNGEPYGSKIIDSDTGEELENVLYVKIEMDAKDGGVPHVEIGLVDVPFLVYAADVQITPPGHTGFIEE